jgi:hypothetical protein
VIYTGAAMQSVGSSDSLDTDSSDDELDPNQMTNEKTYLKTQEFLKVLNFLALLFQRYRY